MTEPTASAPPRRNTRSLNGLVGALVAVVGLVLLLWVLGIVRQGKEPNPAPTVDYRAALQAARAQAPFHVAAPTPEPAELRATSVGLDVAGRRVSWHLGFVTGDQQYVGLYEGNGPADAFIATATPADQPGSSVLVRGTSWQTLTNNDHETALFHTRAGVTTVVTGTAPEDVLASFVASLR